MGLGIEVRVGEGEAAYRRRGRRGWRSSAPRGPRNSTRRGSSRRAPWRSCASANRRWPSYRPRIRSGVAISAKVGYRGVPMRGKLRGPFYLPELATFGSDRQDGVCIRREARRRQRPGRTLSGFREGEEGKVKQETNGRGTWGQKRSGRAGGRRAWNGWLGASGERGAKGLHRTVCQEHEQVQGHVPAAPPTVGDLRKRVWRDSADSSEAVLRRGEAWVSCASGVTEVEAAVVRT